MSENISPTIPFSGGIEALSKAALELAAQNGEQALGAHHWLVVLLEKMGPMLASLAPTLDRARTTQEIMAQIKAGNPGPLLAHDAALDQARRVALERGKTQVAERDLAIVVLRTAGYAIKSREEAWTPAQNRTGVGPAAAPATPGTNTPTLDQFGCDLTREAREGRLPTLVHRDAELNQVIETLCRRTKRNPVLVGPAGVGKTAIVEGLAQRIAAGEVPELLKAMRIVMVQPSAMVAGTQMHGSLEERMKSLIAEAKQPGVILFIDELHTIIGAGGMPGATDMSSLLKPVLARGEIACIGATTDDEYRRFIESDKALERRFNLVRVQELDDKQTLAVLSGLRQQFATTRRVEVSEDVLAMLVRFADQHMKNRNFPDKAIDLLEQCVAHALVQGKTAVDLEDARTIGERMVGAPVVDTLAAIPLLRQRLTGCRISEPDAEEVANRLQLTLRSLDLRSLRPNLVVLLSGEAADGAGMIGAAIADVLFGDARRVVQIDFSPLTEDHDISSVLGARPGYIGYSDATPLHRLAQMPAAVLICQNVDQCHSSIRNVVAQALADGYFTDGGGRRIFLSDAVVLLTVERAEQARRRAPLGFLRAELPAAVSANEAAEDVVGTALEPGLLAHVDQVITRLTSSTDTLQTWLREALLPSIGERYAHHDLIISWDDSFVQLLIDNHPENWERYAERVLGPHLVPHLPQAGGKEAKHITVTTEAGAIKVVEQAFVRQGGQA